MFNIKTVPYCSDQHILKAASFTLKVNTHFSLVTGGCQMVTDQSLGFFMTDALSGRKFLTLDMSARLSFHILIIYIAVDLYIFKCATFIHNI